jgi:phage-related protein
MPTVAQLDIQVDADIASALGNLAAVDAMLKSLSDADADIDIDTGLQDAIREIGEAKAAMASIGDKTATVHVRVERSQLRQAISELGDLGAEAANAGRDMDRTVRLVIGLAPLIAPAFVAAAGGLGALTAGFIAAGTGAVGFGAVTAGVFKPVFDGLKKINSAQDAYTYAVTDDQRKAALEREKAAWDSLTGSQEKMARGIQAFTGDWTRFAHRFEPQIFDLASRGLDRFGDLLPRFAPIIDSFADAVGNLGTRLSRALDTPRYEEFFDFIARQAGPTFEAWGRAFGNIIEGLLSMSVAFEPLLNVFNEGFVDMTRRFADWAAGLRDNPAFQEFVDNVMRYTPIVLSFIGSLARAFWELIEALAPLGAKIMPILTDFFNAISDFAHDNPALAQIFAGILGFFSAIIGFAGPVRAVALAVRLVGGAFKVIGAALGGVSLGPVAAVAAAIIAIGAAAVWAYQKFEPFRDLVQKIGGWLQQVGTAISTALPQVWAAITTAETPGELVTKLIQIGKDAFGGLIDGAKQKAEEFFVWVTTELPTIIEEKMANIGEWWVDDGQKLMGGLVKGLVLGLPLLSAFLLALPVLLAASLLSLTVAFTMMGAALVQGLIQGLVAQWPRLVAWLQAGWADLRIKMGEAWTGIRNAASVAWSLIGAAIQGRWNEISARLGAWLSGITQRPLQAWNAIRAAAATAWNAVKAILGSAWAWIVAKVTEGANNAKMRAQQAWNAIKATASSAWNAIKAAIAAAISSIVATITAGVNNAKMRAQQAWNAIKSTASAAWNSIVSAVRSGASQVIGAVQGMVSGVIGALRSIIGQAYSAGAAVMSNFADGVASAAGRAISAAQNAVSTIAGLLPGSPAEWGPLSGQGYVYLRGQRFSEDLAAGIAAEEAAIRRAAQSLAGTLAFNTTPPVTASALPAAGGGTVINNYYTVNAGNYVGPEENLLQGLVGLNRRGALRGLNL